VTTSADIVQSCKNWIFFLTRLVDGRGRRGENTRNTREGGVWALEPRQHGALVSPHCLHTRPRGLRAGSLSKYVTGAMVQRDSSESGSSASKLSPGSIRIFYRSQVSRSPSRAGPSLLLAAFPRPPLADSPCDCVQQRSPAESLASDPLLAHGGKRMPGKGKRVSDLPGGTVGVCFGTAEKIPPHVVHDTALACVCKLFRSPSAFFAAATQRLLFATRVHNMYLVHRVHTARVVPFGRLSVYMRGSVCMSGKTVTCDGCRHCNDAGETSDVARGDAHLREDAHFVSPGLMSLKSDLRFPDWLRNVKTAHAFNRSIWLSLVRSISGHFMRTDAVGYAGQLPALP
jgi:hypothetical protein